MTRKEAAGVIKFEKACVLRQDTPRCNRDCKKCDLLLPTEDVLTAYDMAIKALEQQPCEDSTDITVIDRLMDGVKADMVAMLTELQMDIEECVDGGEGSPQFEQGVDIARCQVLAMIDERINGLRG